ncbi:hypothetical protein ACFLRC_01660 [Candidatus Altiarchaeota archaeon]
MAEELSWSGRDEEAGTIRVEDDLKKRKREPIDWANIARKAARGILFLLILLAMTLLVTFFFADELLIGTIIYRILSEIFW